MIKFTTHEQKGPEVTLVFQETEGNAFLDFAKKHSSFSGKTAEVYYLPSLEGEGAYLLGLGEEDKVDSETIRKAFFALAKAAKSNKTSDVQVTLPEFDRLERKQVLECAIEGSLQSEYAFSKKSKKEEDDKQPSKDFSIHFSEHVEDKLLEEVETEVRNVMEGVFLARDLVNLTANDMYPEVLASRVEEVFQDTAVKVEVFTEDKIQKLGMDAFYAVAQGSDRPPRFIVMEYQGAPESEDKTVLVGKGLTYDSGGYCLKPPQGMLTMHCDMGGAGTVIGTMLALAKNEVKANVSAVVAACENLISGKAFKTGDIISSLSGKTIEVVNTDAEGRLTLADALYYATDTLAADRVIDLATLTGAVVAALADEYTGAVTNNVEFYREFETAATEVGEKVWLLPNDENLKEMNKTSKVADLVNSGGRGAGTITAGLFVGEFLAKDDIPWLHLDIAGTAYASKAKGYLPERARGVHVKALYQMLKK